MNSGAVNYSLFTVHFAKQWRSRRRKGRRRRKGEGQLTELWFAVVVAAHDGGLVDDAFVVVLFIIWAETQALSFSFSSSVFYCSSFYLDIFCLCFAPLVPLSSLSYFSLLFLSHLCLFDRPLFYHFPRKMCPLVLKTIYLVLLFFSLCSSPLSKIISPQFSQKMSPRLPPSSYVIFFLVPLFFISFLLKTIYSQNLPLPFIFSSL